MTFFFQLVQIYWLLGLEANGSISDRWPPVTKSYVKSSSIDTFQLKPYTFHSLSSLCLPSLTFLSPLSSSRLSLFITLSNSWTLLVGVYSHASLQRAELGVDYSSVSPSVRTSVPLLVEAQNLCFRTILSEISKKHFCILQHLATVALKTQHRIDT